MIEPKKYKFNPDVPISVALKAGFELKGNNLEYRIPLYKYDNSNQTYIKLIILVENMTNMVVTMVCNDSDIYIPFVNPDMRHNNTVYEKVIRNYHNIMDKLCKKKILMHERVKHGRKD